MAQKAVLLLDHVPNRDSAEKLAQRIALQYSDEDQDTIVWYLCEDPPEWVNIGLADQLSAHKRDCGSDDPCYMAIIMCTREEANSIDYE